MSLFHGLNLDPSSSVTLEVLHDVAAKNNMKVSPEHEEAFLLVLQSADATAANIDALPNYIDPRLAPVATKGRREFRKPSENSYNAWSHQANLVAEKPLSTLLEGRTLAIKGNMSVGGLPYTCGMFPQFVSKANDYPIAQIDAIVVRRILEASGRILGTATCENYSLTPMSYTSASGPVHNPWLKGHNTGGSTSGGACALALRQARAAGVPGLEGAGPDVDIAMGGDQAGSIRLPSSYVGCYGLKPTYGLVPYTGISGLHPAIDFTGPMAHNVQDIATMLTVLAGWDGLDPRMSPESPLRENAKQYHTELAAFDASKSSLKIGIVSESLTTLGTSEDVARVVSEAAKKHFGAAGATVSDVSIPMHLLGPAIWTAATRNHMAGLVIGGRTPDMLQHNMPHFEPRWPPDQEMYDILTHANPAVINVIFGETLLREKYGNEVQGKAHRHVFELRAAYDKALEEFDVLITPTTPTVAPPLPDMRPEKEGGSSLMDKIKLAVGSTNQTCPFNATGHPALSVPCGWAKSRDGKGWLPVGMQVIGKRWDDLGVLKAAKVFEAGGGGLGKWPGVVE
jgi:amidase